MNSTISASVTGAPTAGKFIADRTSAAVAKGILDHLLIVQDKS